MPDLVFVAALGDVDGDVFLDDVLTLQRWGAAPSLHGQGIAPILDSRGQSKCHAEWLAQPSELGFFRGSLCTTSVAC